MTTPTGRPENDGDGPPPARESTPWALRDLTWLERRDLRDEYEDRYRPERWELR